MQREKKVKTDSYGDFWFEDLKEGVYDLEIKSGKKKKAFKRLMPLQMISILGIFLYKPLF